MPDITCKAIFVVHLPLGFVILLWDVHGAGLSNYFLKFSHPKPHLQLPECGTSHRPETSGPAPSVGRGREVLCSVKLPCPGNFLWPFLTDKPPPPAGSATTFRHESRTARDASREGAPCCPPALPSLPLLRSRREPGCWILSLRRVLHFHKRAAAPRG